ncbi:general secretion pathway protein GspE, partial [Pseudomonas sp. GW456-11-11-14-TSB2]
RFYGLERVTLQEMLAAVAEIQPFAPRFLREMTVFPYRSAEGKALLAVADPAETAAMRAAQIVLGADIAVKVASFEDIAVALD